jgi:serine/threonine protein kinase
VRHGTVLAGRYEIIALLGRGGMGRVYRARHLTLQKELAIKVLAAGPADFEARFEREARAIARLDHPNCVRVLDYGKSAEHHYIAMDLVAGQTLATALRDGPLPLVRALHIARGLLSALAHAHAHGVLHRDVKPENVVLAGARPVLIDFGLAALEDHPALTAYRPLRGRRDPVRDAGGRASVRRQQSRGDDEPRAAPAAAAAPRAAARPPARDRQHRAARAREGAGAPVRGCRGDAPRARRRAGARRGARARAAPRRGCLDLRDRHVPPPARCR